MELYRSTAEPENQIACDISLYVHRVSLEDKLQAGLITITCTPYIQFNTITCTPYLQSELTLRYKVYLC